MRYPVLELFGKMYHSILQRTVWRRHVGWHPVDHQYDRRVPLETSGVYFGYVKTFRLSVELANISIDTSLNIFVVQTSKTCGESTFSCT